LELLPREFEMQGKASADIALDTWEFGGHTTSVDSLWVGVPVLTFAGPSLMSRVSSSLLVHLGQLTKFASLRFCFSLLSTCVFIHRMLRVFHVCLMEICVRFADACGPFPRRLLQLDVQPRSEFRASYR